MGGRERGQDWSTSGSAGAEYGVVVGIMGVAAIVLGIVFQQWLARTMGGDVAPTIDVGLVRLMGSWGSGSGLVWALVLGVGGGCVLGGGAILRKRAGRGRRMSGWVMVLAVAAVGAGACMGARALAERFSDGATGAASLGMPSTGMVVAVVVAICSLAAGAWAVVLVRPRSVYHALLTGLATGLLLAAVGQMGRLAGGAGVSTDAILTVGATALLGASGGLAGSALSRGRVGDLEEGLQ